MNTLYSGNSNNGHYMVIRNWDWQPQKLKEQFGQLLYKDVKYELGQENDLFMRIASRLNKSIPEVMNILRKLKPF